MEVRVYRGRADEPAADRDVTADMLTETAETGILAVRVWQPHRQIAFGRRDSHAAGYETAKAAAEDRGYHALVRRVGGRAVAYTGRTLAVAAAVPIEDVRQGMCDRYDEISGTLVDALSELGADVTRGESVDAYCPGSHSISSVDAAGEPHGKLAGIAQRVQSGAALVAASLTVAEADVAAIQSVLGPVYRALDVPFDPSTVGSVATAGGPTDPGVVREAVEDALVDGRDQTVVRVGASTVGSD
ncbi:lipoyl protein ligase domain-containing protein [Halohasta salina]|uniref:lipoyl protein ligase domain-containing protein n=1 Tax=Halohasta salina TaxID=2961621 RepID=UPI0020A44203|nr:lipoate--protein ligase family protein [Halohasta salina]